MPPKSGGGKKSKAAKQVTNKRRRGFIDPDLRVSKRQERKDDAKFVKAKFGNFQGGDGRDEGAETQVASTSSSEDEDLDAILGRRPPRRRTHVFKNFAQRVAEVDVDVHRTTGALRVDPLQGSACFFHETLVKCAELNCGAHFSDFKREAEPLCQSLPMLVLHQDKVLASLLERLVPEARHSLEALLRCLQALARDLRGDFAPSAFQRAAEALAALMRANEIAREPEILEHVFQALAFMCKWLQRPLAGDLVQALRKTRALRRHPQAHVRVFAAQAVAFLLRVAPETNGNVARGVRALLAEACGASSRRTAKETEADLHGAGALIAEAAKGAAHGMHSRAARVLRVALRPRRVEGASFFSEKEKNEEKHGERDGERDDDAADADARLGRASAVAEHAVAALYVGRLNVLAKMNPALMAQALERVAGRTDQPIHWVVSGWAPTEADWEGFHAATRAFCPSVTYHAVDGRKPDTRFSIWSAADLFISFSDNIQETFGLTPAEAMAAGLPCVVSDWNGYRDTVRHGLDGFRIPTCAPRPGLTEDLVFHHDYGWTAYENYVGAVAQMVSIDLEAASRAILDLVENPDLRRRMGAAGRRRIDEALDWKAVIPRYQAFWGELASRRAAAQAEPPATAAHLKNPRRLDPLTLFASYPTQALHPADRIVVGSVADWTEAEARLSRNLAAAGQWAMALPAERKAIFDQVAAGGGVRVHQIVQAAPADRRPFVERSLTWMMKFDVLRLARHADVPPEPEAQNDGGGR